MLANLQPPLVSQFFFFFELGPSGFCLCSQPSSKFVEHSFFAKAVLICFHSWEHGALSDLCLSVLHYHPSSKAIPSEETIVFTQFEENNKRPHKWPCLDPRQQEIILDTSLSY